MPLSRLLRRERVAILDAPIDREGVIDRAAGLLAWPAASGPSAPALATALRDRERLASTALGQGVAIPHARIAELDRPHAAFLRLITPVDFEAPDDRPVDLVLAMALPEQAVAGHLVHLAEIAERFSDDGFRDALRAAANADELARLLLREAA